MKLETLLVKLDLEAELNIGKNTAAFLSILVKSSKAENLLEITSSSAYSTLCLASSIPDAGFVSSIEIDPERIDQTKQYFEAVDLSNKVQLLEIDAIEYFTNCEEHFDLVFLNLIKLKYFSIKESIVSAVKNGGLLICDNVLLEEEKSESFLDFVKSLEGFKCSLIPIERGLLVALKDY